MMIMKAAKSMKSTTMMMTSQVVNKEQGETT